MTKLQTWLSGLLILQAVIAAVLFWNQQQPQQQEQQQSLLSFAPEKLDRIVISDAESSVTLSKSAAAWTIPDLNQLPADADKLKNLLDKLRTLQTGWPVATSAGSQQRFEVADDKFQRRLQLYQHDALIGELFIGTSPGFRKSHVRRKGEETVYSVKLNRYEWPVKKEEWLDKSLLAAGEVKRIEGSDYALEKLDDGWHFANDPKNKASSGEEFPSLDQEKATQLASALANLRVQATSDNPPDFAASANKARTLLVSDTNGKWRYQFMQLDGQYFVQRDDRKQAFTIGKFDFDRIAAMDLSSLVVSKTEPDEKTEKTEEETPDGEQ